MIMADIITKNYRKNIHSFAIFQEAKNRGNHQ